MKREKFPYNIVYYTTQSQGGAQEINWWEEVVSADVLHMLLYFLIVQFKNTRVRATHPQILQISWL